MLRRLTTEGVGILAILVSSATAGLGQEEGIASPLGFAPGSRAAQARAEARALAVPTPDSARALLRVLTEEPHVAGTPADHKTALLIRDKLRDWGWKAELAEYEVLLNYPVPSIAPPGTGRNFRVGLRLVEPTVKDLSLCEAALASRQGLGQPRRLPRFPRLRRLGSTSGARSIYANYGRPEDFASSGEVGDRRQGQGRPGALRRDLPRPEGPQRPEARGGGDLDLFRPGRRRLRPGGRLPERPLPTRLGGPARERAVPLARPGRPLDAQRPLAQGGQAAADRRLERVPDRADRARPGFGRDPEVMAVKDWEKATGLKRDDYFATIPSLPISYDAARPILEALGGPNVPSGWQGGLPFAYHVGPGPAEVQFAVDMDYQVRTIWNVIATIPGEVEPDRWVIDRQPPRRLGLRRGRSGQRDRRDAGDVPRPGVGREAGLEAPADARLRELGRRGIRPGRLDRVGRRPRQARSTRRPC